MGLKQYHVRKVNSPALEINWDVFNICNYDCSYCYMKDKPDDWLKIANWNMQRKYAEKLRECKLPIHISLVGGEPSLFPRLDEFVSLLGDVTVITNLSKLPDITDKSRVKLNVSYHVEDVEDENFINNIKKLAGYREVLVTILMHHSKKYWERIANMVEHLNVLGIDNEPAYLTRRMKFFKYPKGFGAYADRLFKGVDEYIFEYDDHTEKYSEGNLYIPITNNQTNFKGYECHINRYNINIDGNISKSCTGDSIHIDDLINIEKIEPVICPYEQCSYNCHLSFTKYERTT